MRKDHSYMDIALETKKIIKERSKVIIGATLHRFIRGALPQNTITIYEAFQLMEMSNRYMYDKFWSDSYDVVKSMNLALLSKLFNEEPMYKQFCEDARERLIVFNKVLKKSNGGKMPEGNHYILSDLENFLSVNLECMEKLSYVRKHARRNNPGFNTYHFECFPYDNFKYEDELIKILKGETDHYEVDKTISPEVCKMMIDIELRVDDVS